MVKDVLNSLVVMNEKKKSLFALHFSSLLFGGTVLFAKLIDLPVIDITAVRTLIALACLWNNICICDII